MAIKRTPAAASGAVGGMTNKAAAMMERTPDITVRLEAISAQLIRAIFDRASATIPKDIATPKTPAAASGAVGGMTIRAPVTMARAPAKDTRPFAISPHE